MAPLLDLLITLLHWGAAGWRAALARREALYGYTLHALRRFAAAHGERVLHTPGNPISLALTLASFDSEGADGGEPVVAAGPAAGGGVTLGPASAAQVAARGAAADAGLADGQQQQQQEQQQQQQQPGGVPATAAAGPPPDPPITFLGSMLFGRCVSGTRVVARGKAQQVGGLAFSGYGAHCDAYPADYLTVAAAIGTTEAEVDEFLSRLATCFAEFRRRRRAAPARRAAAAAAQQAQAEQQQQAEQAERREP